MKTKQTYFVKGEKLQEKRTQFLQARCEENQYFGMSNVGDWLLTQRQLERPTDIEEWTRIIQCNANMVGSDIGRQTPLELLCRFGLRLDDDVDPSQEELSSLHNFQEIHKQIFHVTGNRCAPFVTDSGIFYLSHDRNYVMRFDGNKNGGTYTASILCSDVLISAFLKWLHHEYVKHALFARDFICDWLERRIQYILAEGGWKFNRAVAVSEDGTKIVTADRVVFSRPAGPSLMYGKDLFLKKKIVSLASIFRDTSPIHIDEAMARENGIPDFIACCEMRDLEHWQQYFTKVILPTGAMEKWLWCHIGYDDFPEGGTPFKL